MENRPEESLLGKESPYCHQYDPSLLFPIPRQQKREELGISADSLPFHGVDVWTAYEVSWLNEQGKPEARMARFTFDAASPNLIESKSFKLYLNSFNGSHFGSDEDVIRHLETDLSKASGKPVLAELFSLNEPQTLIAHPPHAKCLDDLPIEVAHYQVEPKLLKAQPHLPQIGERLYSHLLKSNCLVTGQPDWGSVVIEYEGVPIRHESLLAYIVSFREHNEFHEQCVERIFTDLMQRCRPKKLLVYARYVRRGGLDINPYRANFEVQFDLSRFVRQ